MHKDSGFTLIELLVVISVIGLLSSILLVALNNARSKARDTKRKADLHQIAQALALFYDKYDGYPAMGASSTPNAINGFGGRFANSSTSTGANSWGNLSAPLIGSGVINTVPVDPLNTKSGVLEWYSPVGFAVNSLYHYYSNGTFGSNDASHYILCSWLENHSDTDTLQFKDVADPFGNGYLHKDNGYSAYNYCIAQ